MTPPGYPPHQRLRGPQDLRCLIGWLGEETAIRAFETLGVAAQRWPAGAFHVQHLRHADALTAGYDVLPDLWLPDEAGIVEVKAALLGRRFYLPTRQAKAYQTVADSPQEAGPQWPVRRPRLIYAFVAFHYAREGLPKHPTVAAALECLQPAAIVLADADFVAGWAAQVGDYGHDWASKHTGETLYENLHRLTVRRTLDFAQEALKTAYAAQKEGQILRLESENGRQRARSGENLVGMSPELAFLVCGDAEIEPDWPPDVGF